MTRRTLTGAAVAAIAATALLVGGALRLGGEETSRTPTNQLVRAGLEEQAGWAESEEREPGWVEASDQLELQHVAVEVDSTVEVLDVLGHLAQTLHVHWPNNR